MGHNLLTFGSKDWVFLFEEQLQQVPFIPFVWDPMRGNGFGGNASFLLWLRTYFDTSVWTLFNVFKFNWLGIELTIFWLVFFILSLYSVYNLVKIFFVQNKLIIFVFAALIYIFNTYILMVLNGGQLGILLSYAIAPLVFSKLIELLRESGSQKKNLLKKIVVFSLVLAFQVLFDPRIFIVTMVGVFAYFIYQFVIGQKPTGIKNIGFILFKKIINVFIIPGILVFLLHLYWILPSLLYFKNAFTEAMGVMPTLNTVKFFSFSDFSHAFVLLHPNWPENIFGKTYFLQPEFLLLPIFAYSSLLFINSKIESHKIILFFSLLGLIGVFLAKGAKDPFGEIYLWMFNYIPGFIFFRDSTKFYLLIALSYSVLIPFSVWKIFNWMNSILQIKFKFLSNLFLLFVILYLIFLVRPLFLIQHKGTFKLHEVPYEYIKLKDFLNNQKDFFRVLWIPQRQRFGFYSDTHPPVSAQEFFKVKSSQTGVSALNESMLQELSVKYLIVPFDSQEELFLEDRKYSEKNRNNIDKELSKFKWLKKINEFNKISVYQINDYKGLFRLNNYSINSSNWEKINPTLYKIDLVNINERVNLVFSQQFDSLWILKINGETIRSKKLKNNFMSFEINKKGNYSVYVEYQAQKYLEYGKYISLISLISIIIFLLRFKERS